MTRAWLLLLWFAWLLLPWFVGLVLIFKTFCEPLPTTPPKIDFRQRTGQTVSRLPDCLPGNFRKVRIFLYYQVLDKILAAIFRGVTERIYGRTIALRSLPAYLRTVAYCSQPWFPSHSAPPAVLVSSNATASSPVVNWIELSVEISRFQPCSFHVTRAHRL